MNTLLYKNKAEKIDQLRLHYDKDEGILWLYMNPTGRQCFSIDLLEDMRTQHSILMSNHGKYPYKNDLHQVKYQVLTSETYRPYNLGGDLELFVRYIKHRDRYSLTDYAKLCIDVLYPTMIDFNSTLTTISLVRGQALGGGFESALSCSTLIAERSSKLGLPEILFNLFPGMGAYHLLAQRLPLNQVEKMIMSGKIYGAEELFELGVVDILAEDGEGEMAVYDFVRKHQRNWKTQIAVQKVRKEYQPTSYLDLMRVCDIWVDAAMQLTDKELRVMERLVKAQYRMAGEEFNDDLKVATA